MIDNETLVFSTVSSDLRAEFEEIYVIGENITSTPPRFPAVSVIMEGNSVNKRYSTFSNIENVAKENYKIEIFSNLLEGKKQETKDIADVINASMDSLGYVRTFNQPISNIDPSIARRILKFEKNNVI